MANYAVLKAAINAVIKTNGNKEITGQVLNQTLMAIVDSLGENYQFAGVAVPSTNPGTPDQNIFYLATQAGTYTNFGATVLPAGISMLEWKNNTWSSETFFTIDDAPTAGSDHLVKSGGVKTAIDNVAFSTNEKVKDVGIDSTPTSGSDNLIKSGAVFDAFKNDGGAYDVSVHFPTGGVEGGNTYTLDGAIAMVPLNMQKGGMSIKFVDSSNNKYIQARLMAQNFTTDVTQWQGVDDEPTAGSKNLVTSGGVKGELDKVEQKTDSPITYLSFIGNANSFSAGSRCYDLIKGHKYRLYVDPEIDMTGVTDSGLRLEMRLYSQSNTIVRRLIEIEVGTSLQPYYDFEIEENESFAYMSFGGRCAQNVEFKGYIDDITFVNTEIASTNAEIEAVKNNLSAATNCIRGYYLDNTGSLVEDANGSINKEIIPVVPGTTILWKSGVANSQYNLICYGSDGVTKVDNWRSYNASDNECPLTANTYFIKGSFKNNTDGYIKKKSDGTLLFETKIGCIALQEQCDSLQEQIDDINDQLHSGDIVTELNVDMIPTIQAAGARPEAEYYADVVTQYRNNKLLPVLAIITDAHILSASNPSIIERAFAYVDNHSQILATLGLGDIANDGNIFRAIDWNTLESKFQKPILFIPGNHESYMGWNNVPPFNAVESDLMSKWYNETLRTRNGEIHADVNNTLKSYWYRDFSIKDAYDNVTRTLRVVGLNCYTVSEDNSVNPWGFSKEQIDWLISLLENCGSNTHVVIINHEAISTQLKANRYTEVFNMPSYSRYSQASRSFNVIAEIVNAWKHRLELEITYNGNSYTHNFGNAGGNFVCYFTGHEHIDGVYKHQTYQDQIEVSLICTSADESQQMCDLPRVKETRTEDAFTLFSYDWYNNRVNLIRIGSNVTTAMRDRKYDNIAIPQ